MNLNEKQIALLDGLYRNPSLGLLNAPALNTYLKQQGQTGFTISFDFSFFVQKLVGVYQTFLGFKIVERLWGGPMGNRQKSLLNAIPSSTVSHAT